jgi:hypothetical protein
MTHLEDNLAEYVFEELSSGEMESARQHVSQCLECQGRVSAFLAVRKSLDQLPDIDLPQRMVFVPQRPRWSWLSPAWALPAAAALLLAVFLGAAVDLDWNDAGLQIAWGTGAESDALPPATLTDVVSTAPMTIDYDQIDYQELAVRVREDQQNWMSAELVQLIEVDAVLAERINAADASGDARFESMRAELAYLVGLQRAAMRDAYQNASSIQLIAQQTGMME